MDIKVEISPKEITAKVETPNEPIYGGTKDYTKLDNLPSINGYVIIGDMSLLQLGIQPIGDYAKRSELPQNVSDLNNDAGYLVQSDLTDYAKLENLPTKVSELENDSDYATKSDLPTKTSELENDSNYAKTTDIPTNTSQLNNDSNFAYVSDIPTKFSELENDSLKNVDNTSDENKPVSIAQRKAIDDAYANSNAYTDQKIADLIGGAPETLDTLKEVADAIAESKDVETALNNAIGTKANQTELDTHTGNDTIHITADERTNWNDANSKKHTHSNKSVIDKITQTLIDSWNAAYNHISDTVKHITSSERTAWNNKYAKPSGGIPKTDLASAVQTSLGKADTALQEHQDISGLATKAEFDKLNNNLNQLELSDVAGGKNLCLVDREDSNGWSYSKSIHYKGTYTVSSNNTEVNTAYIIDGWHDLPYSFTANGYYDFAFQKPMSITSKCIQIEEGTTATDYEPYIPSVKMLAEEVSAQNDSLAEQGLIDIADNQYFVGYYTNVDTKEHNSANIYISDTSIISVQKGDLITVRVPKNNSCKIGISFMNTATTGTDVVSIESVTEFSAIAPSGSYKAIVWMRKTDIVQSDFERIHIYKNNSIDELKNDLVSLKNLFSSNITGIKLNGTTLEVSFNNGTSKGKVTFDGIAEEETIIS